MRRVSRGYGSLLEGVSCAWSVEGFDVVQIDILLFGLLSFDCADIVLRVARGRVFVTVFYNLVVVWAGVRYFIGFFNYLELFPIFL